MIILWKFILFCLLACLYVIGFGMAYLFAMIFNPKLLGFGKRKACESFWRAAQGYEEDLKKVSKKFIR
jgi:hypothetical protein